MILYLEKSKCVFEETANGMAITINTDKPIIVSAEGKDYILCQSIPVGEKVLTLPQPVILGHFKGLEL